MGTFARTDWDEVSVPSGKADVMRHSGGPIRFSNTLPFVARRARSPYLVTITSTGDCHEIEGFDGIGRASDFVLMFLVQVDCLPCIPWG